VRERVFLPVLAEMARRGAPFRGLLYAGLMVDFLQNKFWVLEFNSRFGDPETQVLLPRMADDLYDWCEAVAKGDLSKRPSIVSFTKDWAVFVVGAAQGYPEHPRKEDPIEGPLMEATQEPHYFIAGVARDSSGNLVTHGGRVFGALGMGLSCEAARRVAYERLSLMRFKGMQFRTDVARGVK
jgi:phosphoribosylamine---glycine ligase